jgi:hypothetical protein
MQSQITQETQIAFKNKKTFASLIIIVFLTGAILQPLLKREDWPFSRFGMYSDNLVNNQAVKFQADFWIFIRNEWRYVPFHSLNWLNAYFLNLYDDLNVDFNQGLPNHVENFITTEMMKYLKDYPPSAKLRARFIYIHWDRFNFSNAHNPDRYVVIKDQVYLNDPKNSR